MYIHCFEDEIKRVSRRFKNNCLDMLLLYDRKKLARAMVTARIIILYTYNLSEP